MSTLILFEDAGYRNLLPLTYWRTTCELRTGYGSLFQHACSRIEASRRVLYCRGCMAGTTSERFALPVNRVPRGEPALLVSGRLLPTAELSPGPLPSVQWDQDEPIVIHADPALLERLTPEVLLDRAAVRQVLANVPLHEFVRSPKMIRYPWDLVNANLEMLQIGWRQAGRPACLEGRICDGVYMLNRSAIHVGPGSTIKPGVVLDAEHGPIYIGENVTISPCTSIEGPCYIGDGSLIQPGSALRDAMSIGPRCKVGGELESSIIHGYSNKQHDGFLGHAYIGEWVNLAADTVNSDLKNTYGPVRVPINGVDVDSGQMFVGLTMGDHSKTGIGQMFPTGAVVGFSCNVATCEFSPRFVPSFTWLTGSGAKEYDVERCLEVVSRVMARRQKTLTDAERTLIHVIHDQAARVETAMANSSGGCV